MHAAESKRAKWPTGFFVVCTKKFLKKMQIKILFNVPAYPETKGERPTTPAKEINP